MSTRSALIKRCQEQFGHVCALCGFWICECPEYRILDTRHGHHPLHRKFDRLHHYRVRFLDEMVGYDETP